jgi:hypothetical protein
MIEDIMEISDVAEHISMTRGSISSLDSKPFSQIY